ncbi:hybrid sensor histidine kinase/response regulator transcription factor [Nibrella saemangeumensis]|uniref:histidine kinase n=1 Tax=Nibrella saemangeumensis TaxID=1084526 RepID=A0ABP8NBQ6_9BACT
MQHYGVEDGLANREVNHILQDKQGFIWIATKGGLSRFDGKTFTTYNKERNGFAFDNIQFIAQDAEGKLWLMAMQKPWEVMIFDPRTGQAQTFAEKIDEKLPRILSPGVSELAPVSSPDGTVFLTGGHQPALLLTYHPKTGLRRTPFPQYKTLALAHPTRHGTVWAVADNHLMVELTDDGRVLHQYEHSVPYLTVLLGSTDNEGPFFYAEFTGTYPFRAVYGIDEQGNRREWPKLLLGDMSRYRIPVPLYLPASGLIWEGTRLIDPQRGVLLDLAQQGYGDDMGGRGIYRDRSGRLWLAGNFGVHQVKLSPSRFKRLFHDVNYKPGEASAVRGIRLIGNDLYVNIEAKGLYKADRAGGNLRTLFTIPGFAAMYGLGQDRQGRLVAGANGHFLQSDTARRNLRMYPLPVNARQNLWTLYAFSDTHLLGGCEQGLRLIEAATGKVDLFRQYNQFSELAEAHVLHIAPDRQGTLWVCANTGLYTFDPQRGITARYWSGGKGNDYLPADNIQHFYHAPGGLFWLATADRGLVRWDRTRGQVRTFRRADGLSNDNIYAVYADRRGNFWLSSDYGIMQFNPRRQTTRTYLVEDGITNAEFNRVGHFQDTDGRIYFGGLNGITTFDPRDFENEKPPERPPLYLTAFRQLDPAQGKVVDKTAEVLQSGRIEIPPGDAGSVLEFAFLNFDDAVRNIYAYQVVGLGEGWVTQAEPTLRLSNLPYGEYQLQVRAQAANGQWSANTLTLAVTVLRPFYLRTWFLAFFGALLAAGVWGWLRWRTWSHTQEQQRLQAEIKRATVRIEQDKETIARQAEALQELDQTKSRFFANISHEFRTPLTVILGMAGELKDKADQPPQRLRQVAGLIERNGSNLLRLINQILDLSKLEAGEMKLKPIRADLVSFIRYVGESFHSMAKAKEVQLHFLSDQETCEADFDKDKLQDIIANLLGNALKFTPVGGDVYCQLRVQKDWQPLSPEGFYEELVPTEGVNGPWVQIRVSDTGPGIEPASLTRIFDRFYQWSDESVRNPADAQEGGTGIGLALVRELVGLMRGGLAVRNRANPGRATLGRKKAGAEFVVSLPLTRRPDVARPGLAEPVAMPPLLVSPDRSDLVEPSVARPAPAGAGDKPVLLLVEDNEDVASYIQVCVQTDYQVIRAENGQIGIDTAIANMPDLILSDVMMPLKDGYTLCDTLKNDERTSHIPIVLLTAKAAVSDRIAGLRRGADAYLVKPFLREELLVVLSNLLQTRRLLQLHYSQVALGGNPLGGTPPGLDGPSLERLGGNPPETIPQNPAPEPPVDAVEDQFLIRLREVVEAQLGNTDLSVDDICQMIGMSRTGLHLKLTALTGMSISHYLRKLRLRKAQELLSASGLNISEVAYAVGFADPRYFSRVFAEEFGITPGNFRLSSRG